MSDLLDLALGPYRATVDRHGGALARLLHDERPLVVDRTGPSEMRFRGDVLVPWPNRIADGVYAFDGTEHRLPVTEPERATALHGLVLGTVWDVEAHEADRVRLACDVPPQEGYPFALRTTIDYHLAPDGLTVTLATSNAGDVAAPYACGFHPYLLPTGDRMDDVVLDLGASRYMEVTPDRLLPVEVREVAGTAYDFRAPRVLGDTVLDTAFTGLEVRHGRHEATIGDLSLGWDPVFGWLQVFTSPDRDCLAVEPQTCGPGAFTTGDDVVRLEPGDSHVGSWTLGVVQPQ